MMRLSDYKPNQKQLDFHEAGMKYPHRMLASGYQCGKTACIGAEMAMHLTGEYPPTWKGKRYHQPITVWAMAQDPEATQYNPQRALLGREKEIGTGLIPKKCLTDQYRMNEKHPGAYRWIYVAHRCGFPSLLRFLNYEDREEWDEPLEHGAMPDVNRREVWFDEEPPLDIYEDAVKEMQRRGGGTAMGLTPVKGYTEVIALYLENPDPRSSGRHSVQMTIYDVGHLTREEIDGQVATWWPQHLHKTRLYGIPQ